MQEEMIADAVQHNSSFNINHRDTMFKVDVFIPRPRPFQKSQFARAQRQTFDLEPEISANFASAEDTILSKLEWYRMGGELSERQWRDILGVLKTREGEWRVRLKKETINSDHDLLLSEQSRTSPLWRHFTVCFAKAGGGSCAEGGR